MVTTMDVVVDDDCSRTVARIPIIRFEIGLLRILLLDKALPAALPTVTVVVITSENRNCS